MLYNEVKSNDRKWDKMNDGKKRNTVLQITLEDPDIEIKRIVSVPGTRNLNELHRIIQKIMGWEDRHIYFFSAGGNIEITPDPKGLITHSKVLNSKDITVDEITEDCKNFTYYYDMCCFRTVHIEKTGEEDFKEYPEVKDYKGENLPEETGSYSETQELYENSLPDQVRKFTLASVNSELKDL